MAEMALAIKENPMSNLQYSDPAASICVFPTSLLDLGPSQSAEVQTLISLDGVAVSSEDVPIEETESASIAMVSRNSIHRGRFTASLLYESLQDIKNKS
jgi:hypothetical protein